MPGIPSERASDVREALRLIVADPGHGGAALSNPQVMSNLLKDLLPDAPREKNLLVAAAEADLAGMMSEHVAQGIDAGSAVRLAAASFGASTHFTGDACTWVATELAVALDLGPGPAEVPAKLPAGDITTARQPAGPGAGPPTMRATDHVSAPDQVAATTPDVATELAAVAMAAKPGAARPTAGVLSSAATSAILVLAGTVALLAGNVLPAITNTDPVIRIWSTVPFWMASGPTVAFVVAVISGVALLRGRASQIWRAAAASAAGVCGFQMLVFVAAVNEKFVSSYGDSRGIGLVLGALSAVLLIAGSAVELSRQARLTRAAR